MGEKYEPRVRFIPETDVLKILHQHPDWFKHNGLKNATASIQCMNGVSVTRKQYSKLLKDEFCFLKGACKRE